MITKAQALTLDEVHGMGRNADGTCQRWRRNGATRTWKRSPERFRLPVKYGLHAYDAVTEASAYAVHAPDDPDCPMNAPPIPGCLPACIGAVHARRCPNR